MRRWLFNFATVASLGLLLASTVLWVRSYYTPDTVVWADANGRIRELALFPGEIRLAICRGDGFGHAKPLDHLTTVDDRRYLVSRRLTIETPAVGVGYETWPESVLVGGFPGARPTGAELTIDFVVHLFSVRFWVFVTIFSALPVLWLIVKLRRPATVCCVTCGYDLRESPLRCPECGAEAGEAGAILATGDH